jgi:hypothetical protein
MLLPILKYGASELKTVSRPVDVFDGELEKMGTSIQVGEGEGMYRMHIHVPTDKRYEPVDYIMGLGTITKIAIENLIAQMDQLNHQVSSDEVEVAKIEAGQIAVVAVSPGPGISRVFASLGVGLTIRLATEDKRARVASNDILNNLHGKELPFGSILIIPVFPTTFRLFDTLVSYIGHRSPARFWQECCSALDYTRRLPYWRKWNGVFPQQALLPLVTWGVAEAASVSWINGTTSPAKWAIQPSNPVRLMAAWSPPNARCPHLSGGGCRRRLPPRFLARRSCLFLRRWLDFLSFR